MPRPRKPARLARITGKKHWYIVDYDADGRRRRFSTDETDEGAAQCVLMDWIAAKDRPAEPTIAFLLDQRLAALRAAGKPRAKDTPFFHKALKEHFGELRPDQLTSSRLNNYVQSRAHVPAQRRAEMEELRKILKDAERDKLIKDAPHIELPAKNPPRDRFLTPSQEEALLAAANSVPHLHLYIMIALSTGARNGAILGLTWDRVNFDTQRINFSDPTKKVSNKRRTTVPISGELVAELQTAQTLARTSNVIEYNGRPLASVKTAFRNAAKAAGVPWATPHVLKHTVISKLAAAGVPLEKIAAFTATSPATVRRVYIQWSPDFGEDCAEVLEIKPSFGKGLSKRSAQTDVHTPFKTKKANKNN